MSPLKALIIGTALALSAQMSLAFAEGGPRWLCGVDYPYAECAPVNNCGTTPAFPMVCLDASHVVDPTEAACSGISKPNVTDDSGCGELWCYNGINTDFVPCDHPSVCKKGCSSDPVTLTETEQSKISTVCVRNGKRAPSLCPPELVKPPKFRDTCTPVSDCNLLCVTPGTLNVVGCSTDAAYLPCPDSCGEFRRPRSLACSPVHKFSGNVIDNPVDLELCQYHSLTPSQKMCSGSTCDDYEYHYMCSADSGAIVLKDLSSFGECDDAHMSTCTAECNGGHQIRSVACGAFAPGATKPSGFAHETRCSGSKPDEYVRGCNSHMCPPYWGCLPLGLSPSQAVACHANVRAAAACPVAGCGAPEVERGISCMSGNNVVDANLCSDFPMPSPLVQCPAVGTGCAADPKSAHCDLDASGNVNTQLPAGGVSCLEASMNNPYRKAKCSNGNYNVIDEACAAGNITLLEQCDLPACATAPTTYEWHVVKGPCQLRNTHCRSYRVDTVYCAASYAPDVAVDDAKCDADTRPSTAVACPMQTSIADANVFAMTICGQPGVCVDVGHAVVDGKEYPDIPLGTCDCQSDISVFWYMRPFCKGAGGTSIVALDFDEETEEVVFTHEMNKQYNTIGNVRAFQSDRNRSYADAKDPIVGQFDTSTPQHRVPASALLGFAPGATGFFLNITGSLSSVVKMDLPVLCELSKTRCVTGTCNNSTGTCDCEPGHSGHLCEKSVCDDYCTDYGTDSCAVSESGTPECACLRQGSKALYEGSRCEIPASCMSKSCANGGVPTGYQNEDGNAVCSCKCPVFLAGDECDQCKLDGLCTNGGTPSSDCDKCKCKAGYMGTLCSCRSLRIRFTIFGGGSLSWYGTGESTSARLQLFLLQLNKDISNSFLPPIRDVWAEVVQHKLYTAAQVRYIEIIADIGLPCTADEDATQALGSLFATVSASAAARSPVAATYAVTDAVPEVYTLADALKRRFPFAVKDSFILYDSGIGIVDINCDSDSCPTGLGREGAPPEDTTPRGSGGSGLSTSNKVVIGVCVGVGVPLLALFVYLMYRFLSGAPSAKAAAPSNDVEMGHTAT